MKNKKLAIILIIFGFLTLLVVLGSTVFTTSSVQVNWLTSTNVFSTADNAGIVESGEFQSNQSIFLVNKPQYIDRLEKNNPYLKVVNIETVFPNKLVLHVAEREVLYALKVTNQEAQSGYSYVLLDDECKVLEKSTATILPGTTTPIVLEVNNVSLTDLNFTVGEVASELLVNNTLLQFSQALKQLGYNNLQARALVKNLVLTVGTRLELHVLTNWGIAISVEDASNLLFQKLHLGISVFGQYHDANPPVNSGTIVVYQTQSGTVEAGYIPS